MKSPIGIDVALHAYRKTQKPKKPDASAHIEALKKRVQLARLRSVPFQGKRPALRDGMLVWE
jgi:hypothetical protein